MFGKAALAAVGLLAAEATAVIYYAGVAESGGEFGVWSTNKVKGTGLPGTFGVDYEFINKSAVDIYVDKEKVNLFRVAFLLERMCPVATGLGATFNETHYGFFADAINYITVTKGVYAILDPHNYMRYNDPCQQPNTGSIIGNTSDPTAATTAQFGAFWGELAGRFKSNPNVIFGLMNEPHDMDTNLILANDQAAVTAIRAAGANQLILAPGNGYTGGHSWTTAWTGNSPASSDVMYKLTDPLNNTAFDIHEYVDGDYSGTHVTCTNLASTFLGPVTDWLNQYGFKAFVSEWGVLNGTECAPYVTDIINYLGANNCYVGWAIWAAGPLWGHYSACCTDSAQYGSLEPGSTAVDGSPGMYDTVWVKEVEPLIPTTLVKNGTSNVNPLHTTSATTSSVAPTGTPVPAWGQCGGIGYTGSTNCATGTTCVKSDSYYSQCRPTGS